MYYTSEVAKRIGVHVNTIRFYESVGLLKNVQRNESGYRLFTDEHILQLKVLRSAFRAEITGSHLRKEALEIVKLSSNANYEQAIINTVTYEKSLLKELSRALEALEIAKEMLEGFPLNKEGISFNRREMAELLGVSVDVLRDWERNGLVDVPRRANNRRYYEGDIIKRLKVIRTLREANYSMMSIRRMLICFDKGYENYSETIDLPFETEDIINATDRYISALKSALVDVKEMIDFLERLQNITY